MAFVDNIVLEKTIHNRRLYFKAYWLELMDSFVFYLKASSFVICMLLLYWEANIKNTNDLVLGYFILPFLIIFTVFLIVKKYNERNLNLIASPFDQKTNRKIAVEKAKKEGWKIAYNNRDYLRARTGTDLASWGHQVTFIFEDNKIYLNVIRDNPLVRIPVFFTGRQIKKEIGKEIKSLHSTVHI